MRLTQKERPIIMSAESVRAIPEGRKTQTRRVVKPQPEISLSGCPSWSHEDGRRIRNGPRRCFGGRAVTMTDLIGEYSPFGVRGDLLWVRETWAAVVPGGNFDEITGPPSSFPPEWQQPYVCRYRADRDPLADADVETRGFRWRPSIHMPRWASRLTLEVTDVRVEGLREITEEDARAEGVDWAAPQWYGSQRAVEPDEDPGVVGYPVGGVGFGRDNFRRLWDSLNAERGYGWETNPWVWVVSFRRLEPCD